jgi:hypothetical protein
MRDVVVVVVEQNRKKSEEGAEREFPEATSQVHGASEGEENAAIASHPNRNVIRDITAVQIVCYACR